PAFSSWPETPFESRLACNGGARDARQHGNASGHPSDFSRQRWTEESTSRTGAYDARAISLRRCAPWSASRRVDGRRGDRDLSRGDAGDGKSGLGGAFDLGAARSRTAE